MDDIRLTNSIRSFKDFYPRGKCVMALVSEETAKKLQDFSNKHGIYQTLDFNGSELIGSFDFHVTIFHTETPLTIPCGIIEYREPFEVHPAGFEMLGFEQDIPVMRITGEKIYSIRRTYKELYNFEEYFEEWKPHISLSYDKTQQSIENLPMPDFPIIIDRLKISNSS